MQGSTLGTPGYMSPEQAAGRLHELGPASDIFSLGATLYSLLVGTQPFEGKNASEILANAVENRFTEPIKKLPQVPRPLNAIVIKAMATAPTQRYHTAMELAADVEAYLTDDLVSAYQETLWERSHRWIRRHRTLATATFVLISTVGFAATIGAGWLNSEKNRTLAALKQVRFEQQEKSKALDAKSEALDALTEEQERTSLALAAETRARRQTREMLNTISDDLVGELMGQQVSLSESHQHFFDRVLEQFEQFTTSTEPTAEGHNLRADGYFRVANLQRRLGRLDQSEQAYVQAIKSWEKLVADFPDNSNYQQDLAAAQANLGLVFASRANYPEALKRYSQAAELFSSLLAANQALSEPTLVEDAKGSTALATVDESTDETQFVTTSSNVLDAVTISKMELELARLNGNLANTLVQLNRRNEAERYYQQSIQGFSQLPSGLDVAAAADQARVLGNYAAYLSREPNRLSEARELMESALAALTPTEESSQRKLAANLRLDRSTYRKNLGKLLVALGEKTEAIEMSRATVHDLAELVSDYPAIVNYRRELATNQIQLANLLRDTSPDQATAEFSTAMQSFERIAAENPGQIRTQLEIAHSFDSWGTWLYETDFEAARTFLEKARGIRRELLQADPLNPTLENEWFEGENNLANLHRIKKEYPQAIPIYLDLMEALETTENPEDDELFFVKQRIVRFGLADSLSRSDQYEKALPIWNQLIQNRDDPNWGAFELQRAICLIRTGSTEEGLAIATAVIEVPEPMPVWLFDMACCYAIAHEMAPPVNEAVQAEDDSIPESEKTREEFAVSAIKFLNLAGEAGLFESKEYRDHALGDNDLDSLKDRPDFIRFQQKYLVIKLGLFQ